MARLLLVDDETKLARMLADGLEIDGHQATVTSRVREGLGKLAEQRFDVVVTDLRLPDGDGTEVLAAARQLGEGAPDVVIMTGYATTAGAVELMKAGASDFLIKPFSLEEFRLRIRRIAEKRALADRARHLERRLAEHEGAAAVVAQSDHMRRVMEQLGQVAVTDATVLLTGESGTGKSLLARAIHERSARARGALVEMHCGALPEALLESELFGHERGAFTGAHEARAGHLDAARGGTLFLDEIGEVSLAVQVKLLRFLQDQKYVRLGSTQVRTADVRVVAATNRDLAAAIREGRFREDLFYRLSVFPLEVPPLRARPEDVPILAGRFFERRGEDLGRLGPGVLEALQRYPWPGNVRELENVLQRLCIVAGTRPIDASMLPAAVTGARAAPRLGELLEPGFNFDAFERDLIHDAIAKAGGNKAQAARLLGITRRRLYSRLKALDERSEDGDED